MHLIIYFDYTCAFSYVVAVWLREVEALARDLTIEWRPFIVKEINRPAGEDVPFWEQASAPVLATSLIRSKKPTICPRRKAFYEAG